MNNRNVIQQFFVLGFLLLFAFPLYANGAQTITLHEALQLALKNNPSLQAILLQEAKSRHQEIIAEGARPFTLQMDGGYSRNSTPTLLTDNLLSYSSNHMLDLGVQAAKTFSWGMSTSLRLEGIWAQPDNILPWNSSLGARFSVTQPLLRGFGRRVQEASLRQARYQKTIASYDTQIATSRLAMNVQNAFWEAWYAHQALLIDSQARDIAQQQVEEARARVDAGILPPVDLLSFENRLATLQETVASAKTNVVSKNTSLAATLGAAETSLRPDPNSAVTIAPPDQDLPFLIEEAFQHSPQILLALQQIELARDQTKIAAEELRHRLDLIGTARAQTIRTSQGPSMMPQFANGGAWSGTLGFLWEWPLASERSSSQVAAAHIQVDIAQRQLEATRQDLNAQLITAHQQAQAAFEQYELVLETQKIAQQLAWAERERLRLGSTIFTSLRDAEEAIRQADLRVARASLNLVQAQLELQHLTGSLLSTIADLYEVSAL